MVDPVAGPAKMKTAAASLFMLLLALIAGGVLRFIDLDGKSLWRDEVETLVLVKMDYSAMTEFAMEIPYIPVPPLSFYLTRLVMELSRWKLSLRWPAALFGMVLIPSAWLLGRELFHCWGAEAGALLVAVSPFLIRYSQEARSYTMLTAFSTLMMTFILRATREDRLRDWLGFGFTAILGLYTHYFALLAVSVAAIYHGIDRWRAGQGITEKILRLKRRWWIWPLILAAYLPLVMPLMRGLTGPRGLGSHKSAVMVRLADLPPLLSVIGPAREPWLWLVVALALLGAYASKIWKPDGKRLILLWFFVPLIIAALVPFKHVLRLRYLIFIIPAYYLLIASGLAWLISCVRGRKKAIAVAAIIAILLYSAGDGIARYFREGKQDWRSAARFVGSAASPGDVILVDGRSVRDFNLRFRVIEYYARKGSRVRIIDTAKDPIQWLKPRDRNKRFWYINTLSRKNAEITALVPGGERLAARGWHALPPIKFDAPSRLPSREVWWIGPIRYRSVVVVPLERGGAPRRFGEAEAWLRTAKLIPRARVDEKFTRRFMPEAGRQRGSEP